MESGENYKKLKIWNENYFKYQVSKKIFFKFFIAQKQNEFSQESAFLTVSNNEDESGHIRSVTIGFSKGFVDSKFLKNDSKKIEIKKK